MCKELKSELPFLCEEGPMRLEDVVKPKASAWLVALGELVMSELEAGKRDDRVFATAGACRLSNDGLVCVCLKWRDREVVAVTADMTSLVLASEGTSALPVLV